MCSAEHCRSSREGLAVVPSAKGFRETVIRKFFGETVNPVDVADGLGIAESAANGVLPRSALDKRGHRLSAWIVFSIGCGASTNYHPRGAEK